MKRFILYLILFLPLIGYSQNIVPNPSFEFLSSCPTDEGQLNHAVPWFSPTYYGTTPMSDLFDTCAPSYPVGIPLNGRGYHYPRTGHAYAGECVFSDYDETREYISVKLDSALRAGKKYCIGYYVSLSNYNIILQPSSGSRFAIDCMGVFISDTIIHLNTYYAIPVIPQILNPSGSFLTDTLNWMLVSGTYTSKLGGEQYITIGNFFTNDSTNYVQVSNSNSHLTYYYIDDVYVMDCNDTLGIKVINSTLNVSVYPNPASNTITVQFGNATGVNCIFELFDELGNKVFSKQFTASENTANISLNNIAKGVYICRIMNANHINLYNNKLVIIK